MWTWMALLAGCGASLPDPLPLQVRLMAPGGERPIPPAVLEGDRLSIAGREVGTVEIRSHMAMVSWSGPRSDLDALVGGEQLVLEHHGPCGVERVDLTLSKENDPYGSSPLKARTDAKWAEELEERQKLIVWLDIGGVPAWKTVYIGRTDAKEAVRLGSLEVPEHADRVIADLSACTGPIEVASGGQSIGTLDPSVPYQLVSASPELCHRMRFVSYGRSADLPQDVVFSEPVSTLPSRPMSVFEAANPSGALGEVTSELTAYDCPL
ncbi:MAG: hypothetical protein R3F61_25045 [Myxococcota bacterium]